MKLFWPKVKSFEDAFKELLQQPINQPFSENAFLFTQALSKRFLKLRDMPEVVALGYWLRSSNIKLIQQEFYEKSKKEFIKARGTIFHIAPSNVDTIFVYSWILSLMAGNRNILRISTKTELNVLLQIIIEELERNTQIAKQTLICTYDHSEDLTAKISLKCNMRVVWGGDQTIKKIRQIPISPLASELTFADRFSLAVIKSNEVNNLNEKEFDQLLERFYNDSFWFNQMACSSPRLVVWIGNKSERFWAGLEKKIEQKNYELMAATQVIKYTTALQLATENCVNEVLTKTKLTRVKLENLLFEVREKHCGNGLFYEIERNTLTEVGELITDKDQTLVYYGFTLKELEQFVIKINSRGIDRIVPIGQALDFNNIWDGQNFLTSFTREVVIK